MNKVAKVWAICLVILLSVASFHYVNGRSSDSLKPANEMLAPKPTKFLYLENNVQGSPTTVLPANVEIVTTKDGSGFMGVQFFSARANSLLRIRVTANAFADKANTVVVSVFHESNSRPIKLFTKPVASKGLAVIDETFLFRSSDRLDDSFSLYIGPAEPGDLYTNGRPGMVLPASVPPLSITISEERGEMLESFTDTTAVGAIFRDCINCPEMVLVPSGSFIMGSPEHELGRSDHESPQRRVVIPSTFAVGRYPVTFDEWDSCVAENSCGGFRPSSFWWKRDGFPVVSVSWEEAHLYVNWLAKKTGKPYRLLSEAEWEYSTRAGSRTARYWGEEMGSGNANCVGCGGGAYSGARTSPVGSLRPNKFGIHDTLGNVWEWVEDCWHPNYLGAPSDGSSWIQNGNCNLRVQRGGSWFNDANWVRSAQRYYSPKEYRNFNLGFRVARNIP